MTARKIRPSVRAFAWAMERKLRTKKDFIWMRAGVEVDSDEMGVEFLYDQLLNAACDLQGAMGWCDDSIQFLREYHTDDENIDYKDVMIKAVAIADLAREIFDVASLADTEK